MNERGIRGLQWCAGVSALLLVAGCSESGDGEGSMMGGVTGPGQVVTPIPGGDMQAQPPPSPAMQQPVDMTDTGMQDMAVPPPVMMTPMPNPDGAGGTGGMGGAGGMGGGGGGMDVVDPPMPGNGCTPAPAGTMATEVITGTGPDGNYTVVRPTTLGDGGFLHPPVAWGNGLGTTPSLYTAFLENIASNGFVVVANPGTGSNPQVVRDGLEWLIAQNGSGEYAGKLAVDCAGTIGYSMGGGAAIGSGSHPAVKAIVSIHGLSDATERASGAILLLTAEGDTFVTKSGFTEPAYSRSSVQPTMLASHAGGDHLDPIGTGGEDAAPSIAWLRYWIYGDESQRDWFFGESCTLCSWPDVRRKNHPEW